MSPFAPGWPNGKTPIDPEHISTYVQRWFESRKISVYVDHVSDGGHISCGNCGAQVTMFSNKGIEKPTYFQKIEKRVRQHHCSRR